VGSLKVWDGSGWQIVSQQGPTGPPGAPLAHAATHYTGGTDPITGRLPLIVGTSEVIVGATASPTNTAGYTTAVGANALASQQAAANSNTAVGFNSQSALTTGYSNTTLGRGAGNTITTGACNTLVGQTAGTNAATNYATAIGVNAVASGENSIAIGANASATASGSAAIGRDSTGAGASSTAPDQIYLGTGRQSALVPGKLFINHGTNWLQLNMQHGAAAFTTDAGAFFYPSWPSSFASTPRVFIQNVDGTAPTITAVNSITTTYAQCRAWSYGGLLVNTTVYQAWLAIGDKP
jgi:Head domain of trimeric autotransporter adhesin